MAQQGLIFRMNGMLLFVDHVTSDEESDGLIAMRVVGKRQGCFVSKWKLSKIFA